MFPQAFSVNSLQWTKTHLTRGIVRPASRASLCLLEWGGEKEVLSESHQPFEVTAARTSGLVNLVFSHQTGKLFFFECKHVFFDKPMVINEPALASAWLLGLGLKLCLAVHAWQRSYLTHAIFLDLSKPKSSKQKKASAWRVMVYVFPSENSSFRFLVFFAKGDIFQFLGNFIYFNKKSPKESLFQGLNFWAKCSKSSLIRKKLYL